MNDFVIGDKVYILDHFPGIVSGRVIGGQHEGKYVVNLDPTLLGDEAYRGCVYYYDHRLFISVVVADRRFTLTRRLGVTGFDTSDMTSERAR